MHVSTQRQVLSNVGIESPAHESFSCQGSEPLATTDDDLTIRETQRYPGPNLNAIRCATPQSLQSSQKKTQNSSVGDTADNGPCQVTSHAIPASPKQPLYTKRKSYNVRPKSSIPPDLTPREYASQCVAAAESSRLNPHALHEEEHAMLREHISHAQVTTYLNIRNGILRLWLLKPSVAITRGEALGCAKEGRWFSAASVCFDWLVRRGYVNYGCVKIKMSRRGRDVAGSHAKFDSTTDRLPANVKKTIAIVGAGMAGLGCARQLHNLFEQYSDRLAELGLEKPHIIVLEGRDRIGGRVYSRPLQVQPRHRNSDFFQSRCTAEMGGMIVTGFDRGNPMNTLIRGQLGLSYHALLSTTTIYDKNGSPVDATRDRMVEDLFNECLDRVSEYKFQAPSPKLIEGDRNYMDEGRDCPSEGHRTIAHVEDSIAAQLPRTITSKSASSMEMHTLRQPSEQPQPAPGTIKPLDPVEAAHKPPKTPDHEKLLQAGTVPASTETAAMIAGLQLKILGWSLKPGVSETKDIDLDLAASTPGATLGFVVEDAIRQFAELVDLNAQDFRLLNWHIANLEYSNATNHDNLSLLGWDIDTGNEWDGKHSMIVGGYQSVPRGLMLCPTPLDVRRHMAVKKISYIATGSEGQTEHCETHKSPVVIEFEEGGTFDADYVVSTLPLGVLKYGNVEFDPPLPQWKADSIARLGYGVLNKIILTYRQPFWDMETDIFGVLREPTNRFSLDQQEYSKHRGRMFQWFNVTKTTGIPCLIALMAGDAAFDTEKSSNDELIMEATSVLQTVFGAQNVPQPIEAVVTRWASDKFSRGSYSSAGPAMQLDDYDAMARSVGKYLHFAGEHTIGTHPATVHGAYLSGLRAASDIFEELVGPINIPRPLVPPKDLPVSSMKRKHSQDGGEGKSGDLSSGSISAGGGGSNQRETKISTRRRLEAREMLIQEHIIKHIGVRPQRPPRAGDSPYQLFSKANYERARKKCEEGRRPGKGRSTPNEVRALTSKMWRSASVEERFPYAEEAAVKKQEFEAALEAYSERIAEWDRRAAEVRGQYESEHPGDGEHDTRTTSRSRSPSVIDLFPKTLPDRPSHGKSRRPFRGNSHHIFDNTDVDTSG